MKHSLFSPIPLEVESEFLEQYGRPWSDWTIKQYQTYATGIGRLLITFSSLETALDHMIISAISDREDESGYRIIKYLRFKDKAHLAISEYRRRVNFITRPKIKAKLNDQLDALASKLREISEFRNRIAHANWESLDERGFVRVRVEEEKTGNGINFVKIKITPIIMLKFARQCLALARNLDELQEKVNFEMFRP